MGNRVDDPVDSLLAIGLCMAAIVIDQLCLRHILNELFQWDLDMARVTRLRCSSCCLIVAEIEGVDEASLQASNVRAYLHLRLVEQEGKSDFAVRGVLDVVDLQLGVQLFIVDRVFARDFPEHVAQVEHLLFTSLIDDGQVAVFLIWVVNPDDGAIALDCKRSIIDRKVIDDFEADLVIDFGLAHVDVDWGLTLGKAFVSFNARVFGPVAPFLRVVNRIVLNCWFFFRVTGFLCCFTFLFCRATALSWISL
jgi:hypothetical protein